MIVIADTTPLHYLVLIECADILRELYGRVFIPTAVLEELQAEATPPSVKAWLAHRPDWLEVRQASIPSDLAGAQLDLGEREAIALAQTLRADAVVLDDRAARREAERRNLRVIGTLRVLADAAEIGLVDLPQALQRLQAAGFYMDANLAQFVLERCAKRIE
jgi:predicted nucleic acid-binding protein